MKKTLSLVFKVIVVISFMISKTNFNLALNEGINIKIKLDGKVKEMALEDYLVGVVACEMPATFYKEAIKAQAIASRTFALSRIMNNEKYVFKGTTEDQCYITKSDMKKKWGSKYKTRYNKIKDAVYSTKGEYLVYKDKVISALFFSMSNGYTENSEDVFVSSKPYLKSVSSTWDTEYKNYIYTKVFTKKEIKKLLGLNKGITSIKILSRYKTNRVKKIKVNTKKYTGVEFRKLLGLRSTDFDIEIEKDKVIITTRGYGHGVGMSQYGANSMAKLGYNYEEILKYYYQKVNIKKYK